MVEAVNTFCVSIYIYIDTCFPEAVEGIESPQKATAVVKRLVGAELVGVTEVKGKSGKVKGYIKL